MSTTTHNRDGGWDAKYLEQSDGAAWSDVPQPRVIEFLSQIPSHSRVADLGSGDARNSVPATEAGHQVVMLDISPTALALALKRFEGRKPPKPIAVLGSMEEIPLADAQFDAVMALDSVPQVRNCERTVREIHRIMVPGGLCLLNVFTPQDAAWGQGERVGPRSYVYKNCLFNFFEAGDIPELCGGLFNILKENHLSWMDPPHVPFRPFEHRHDAIFYILQKP